MVGAHDHLTLRRECGQATNGSGEGSRSVSGLKSVDRRGVVGVSGKKQTVGVIEQKEWRKRVKVIRCVGWK
jgi:hypothetical protein